MKAIETSGILSKRGVIKLDKPVKIEKDEKVKVIILRYEENDIEEMEWLVLVPFPKVSKRTKRKN